MILKVYKRGKKEPIAIYGGNFSFDIVGYVLSVRTLGMQGEDEYYGVLNSDILDITDNVVSVVVEA